MSLNGVRYAMRVLGIVSTSGMDFVEPLDSEKLVRSEDVGG
jgi:hypothetical protein